MTERLVTSTFRNQMSVQRGVATLLTSVVVLFLVTLMVIFAARVSLFDQRMSANEVRHKEAFAMAEAGVDFAMQRFSEAFRSNENPVSNLVAIVDGNQVSDLTRPDGQPAGAQEGGFIVAIEASGFFYGDVPVFNFISTGQGADGTGLSTVRRQATMVHVLGQEGRGPDVPIIVSGPVGTGGNFNVVANPNAGGPGVPVSIWSNDDISVSASSATCHAEFYLGEQCSNPSGKQENITTGTNPAMELAEYTASMPDLLPHDPNFPDDLFPFVFGLARENWPVLRGQAEAFGQRVQNCNTIGALGATAGAEFPLWWVEGDCSLTAGAVIGSQERPVILVIDDSDLKVNGGSLAGILFLFDRPDPDPTDENRPVPSYQLNGNPEIFGSVISDVGDDKMNGNFSVVYSPNVLNSLGAGTGGGINYTMGHIPGSWRDF